VVAVSDRNTATQSTRRKIGSPLGCLFCSANPRTEKQPLKRKVIINTNAPEEKSGLFAHFFRRKPKRFFFKNSFSVRVSF
jgi:hypothetical protein